MSEQGSAEIRDLLVRLGAGMAAAGEPVDDVRERLVAVATAYGETDVAVVVLPTSVFVGVGAGAGAQVQFGSHVGLSLRFDQIEALYELQRRCEHAELPAGTAIERFDRILEMPPAHRRLLRVLGHGILTAGLALLIQPTALSIALGFGLGILVGLLKLPNLPTLELLFPVVAAFVVSVIVFVLARHVDELQNPLRVLIPPLATYLPGGLLTTATRELAADQMIAGSSRLVAGIVRLFLLAFGISAAAAVVGLAPAALADVPVDDLGLAAPWIGLVLITAGDWLHFAAPPRTLPWILAVLVVAYAGQQLGARLLDPELSAFGGALAMTPLVLWIERTPTGPPALITFLPAFWMLVPGAAGLIGVTELVALSRELGLEDFLSALETVFAIAIGVLVGTALFRTGRTGWRLARAMPAPWDTRRWS